jgi:hypothetical protein
MKKTVLESLKHYEEVKKYFYRPDELDFAVRFSNTPMADWLVISTPSLDDMEKVRFRLSEDGFEFAGYVRCEGRYCFYFVDINIIKIQFLDNDEVDCFRDKTFFEIDLKIVASELRALQGS